MPRLAPVTPFAPAAALAAALILPVLAHAETVRVPGTSVRMTPPSGFTAAEQFPGFQDANHDASIVVTEIPGPVSEVRRGMTRKGLASRGMTLIESSTVPAGEDEALLLHVSQRTGQGDYFKWIVVGGSEARTFMVVGAFPAEDSELSDAVRESVLSASWTDSARPGLYEGLTFRIEPHPRMRPAERMGNLLILTETGRMQSNKPGTAVLIVGSALGEVEIEDVTAFAKERLRKTDRLKAVRFRSDTPVVVDGMPGRELIAEGSDAKDGRPIGVYQLLLTDGKTYYIAQGFVLRTRLGEFLPVFRAVTSSFRRVEPARPTITQ